MQSLDKCKTGEIYLIENFDRIDERFKEKLQFLNVKLGAILKIDFISLLGFLMKISVESEVDEISFMIRKSDAKCIFVRKI